MALVLLDRVQQTGTANTTVSFTLTGSVVGYQSSPPSEMAILHIMQLRILLETGK